MLKWTFREKYLFDIPAKSFKLQHEKVLCQGSNKNNPAFKIKEYIFRPYKCARKAKYLLNGLYKPTQYHFLKLSWCDSNLAYLKQNLVNWTTRPSVHIFTLCLIWRIEYTIKLDGSDSSRKISWHAHPYQLAQWLCSLPSKHMHVVQNPVKVLEKRFGWAYKGLHEDRVLYYHPLVLNTRLSSLERFRT